MTNGGLRISCWIGALAATLLAGCGSGRDRAAEEEINRLRAELAAARGQGAGLNDSAAMAPVEANMSGSPVQPATPPAPRSNWRYDTRTDNMTDRQTRTACVASSNEVHLGSPYGSVRAELCLRDSPQYGRDAIVSLLGDGQILCRSYEPCTVKVRFDDAPAANYSAIGPSDGSSNIIFIRGRDRFERALRDANRTLIQAEFYQAGNQAMAFDTRGFAWPRGQGAGEGKGE